MKAKVKSAKLAGCCSTLSLLTTDDDGGQLRTEIITTIVPSTTIAGLYLSISVPFGATVLFCLYLMLLLQLLQQFTVLPQLLLQFPSVLLPRKQMFFFTTF